MNETMALTPPLFEDDTKAIELDIDFLRTTTGDYRKRIATVGNAAQAWIDKTGHSVLITKSKPGQWAMRLRFEPVFDSAHKLTLAENY